MCCGCCGIVHMSLTVNSMWLVILQLPNLHSKELLRSPRRVEAEAYAERMRRRMPYQITVCWEDGAASQVRAS
jgi:hypothetical protein